MQALDKLVPDEEECAQVRSELSEYISEHGAFGSLYATKDRDRLDPIRWWNMHGSGATYLHKLAVRVLSQVVNSSSAERCWSTYNFIHSVKRNSLNVDRAESLVYVHYNLRLLSHYCEAAKNDRTFLTWDNNPEEANVEDGAIALERLEAELLGDHDDPIQTTHTEMPPPSRSSFPDAGVLPLASQRPISARGGHSSSTHVPRSLPPAPIPPRTREKKLEVTRGKRKA
jgi:hypothetical protein